MAVTLNYHPHRGQQPSLPGGEPIPLPPLAEGSTALVDEVRGLVDPTQELRQANPPPSHLGQNREYFRLRRVFPNRPVDDP